MRLFIDRAVAAQPSFAVTEDNAPAIAQICHRLDGSPLAIELAAPRVKVLSPGKIAERLDDRFRLLTGGSRTALPRHQTLRALIDWSHDLLADREKILFRRVAVFVGGWTLEAAGAVCTGEPIERRDVLDLLSTLVDKSVVLANEQPDGQMRYRLLETLHEYAAERLGEAGERDTILQRHAEHYLAEAERIDEVRRTNWRQWRDEGWLWLRAEEANLRVLLGQCRDRHIDPDGEAEAGLRMCSSTWWFRSIHARFQEACDWHKSLLHVTPVRVSHARFYATWYLGISTGVALARFQESAALLEDAQTSANQLGDEQAMALAENARAQDLLWQGRLLEAGELNERSLALTRRVGPRCYLAIFLFNTGWTALRQGRTERATELLDESITVAEEIGDDFQLSMALAMRGQVSMLQHDLLPAREYLQRSAKASASLPVLALGLPTLGSAQLAWLEGDIAGAAESFVAVLDFAAQTGSRGVMCDCLDGLVFVAVARLNTASAVRLLAAVDRVRASIHQRRPPHEQSRVDEALVSMREALGEQDFASAWHEGQHLTLDEAMAYGRGLAPPVR